MIQDNQYKLIHTPGTIEYHLSEPDIIRRIVLPSSNIESAILVFKPSFMVDEKIMNPIIITGSNENNIVPFNRFNRKNGIPKNTQYKFVFNDTDYLIEVLAKKEESHYPGYAEFSDYQLIYNGQTIIHYSNNLDFDISEILIDDLDSDGVPDLVITSIDEMCERKSIYLSSMARKGNIVEPVGHIYQYCEN